MCDLIFSKGQLTDFQLLKIFYQRHGQMVHDSSVHAGCLEGQELPPLVVGHVLGAA